MSRVAIIGGTGFEKIGGNFKTEIIDTRFGKALVHCGQGEMSHLVFLSRHGTDHSIAPHKINFRANIKALQMLGVDRALATYAVGSLRLDIPPRAMVLLDQFMDFTHGREGTFFDGGKAGLAHTEMSEPYCPVMRDLVLKSFRTKYENHATWKLCGDKRSSPGDCGGSAHVCSIRR